MNEQRRMSPVTAFFLGIFGVVGVAIVSATMLATYAMHIVDSKTDGVIGFAKTTIEGLPGLIDSLPPALGELLNDHRDPEYAANIKIDVQMITDERTDTVRPVLSITNDGDEVVSMLAVRVAVLNNDGVPLGDWTQVVATPIAIEDEWRGPLFPHTTRHVVCSRYGGSRSVSAKVDVRPEAEISELRVWTPSERPIRAASAHD